MERSILRVAGTVVLALVTVAGLVWPVVVQSFPSPVSPPYDPVVITDYVGDFSVAADGTLTATETITAEFPSGRHGIFRYWDLADPSDPGVRYQPTVTSIALDGGSVPVSYYSEDFDRFYVAKIGDPNSYLTPGSHTYVLEYTVPGALAPLSAGLDKTFASTETGSDQAPQSVFYWNVVAQGWEMEIQQATATITLPAPTVQVQCSAGSATGPCAISGAGSQQVTVSAQSLPPRSGMTVRASTPTPAPDRATLPWSIKWDPVLGRSLPVLGVVLIVAAGLFGLGYWWSRSSYERNPGFPVMYAPPSGLGPVQTVYMESETPGGHALIASLLHLADRGVVRLHQHGAKDWTVEGVRPPGGVVDPVTERLAYSLGVAAPGGIFRADGDKAAGQTLNSADGDIKSTVRDWAKNQGYMSTAPTESLGKALILVSLVLAGILFISFLGNPTVFGVPLMLFAIAGLPLLGAGVGTRRTPTGRQYWSQAGGFKRLLSTPSAGDRFDFAAKRDEFIHYVPYAVAFGVADKWAEKYRAATGQEPPWPIWYPYYGYGSDSLYRNGGGGFDSFESAVSSSISAYSASQSSSSGGGGGGGGFGGGGGGGGGGSW